MIQTRGTDERFTIRSLVDNRSGGLSLLFSFFKGSLVTTDDLAKIYIGAPIEEAKWVVVKKVLAERMTRD
jgi:hypothetical protein